MRTTISAVKKKLVAPVLVLGISLGLLSFADGEVGLPVTFVQLQDTSSGGVEESPYLLIRCLLIEW